MLPIFHTIGNVTKAQVRLRPAATPACQPAHAHARLQDGSIKLEPINDCSGVHYYEGLYHVWHQCCQNHFDHIISEVLRALLKPSLGAWWPSPCYTGRTLSIGSACPHLFTRG